MSRSLSVGLLAGFAAVFGLIVALAVVAGSLVALIGLPLLIAVAVLFGAPVLKACQRS